MRCATTYCTQSPERSPNKEEWASEVKGRGRPFRSVDTYGYDEVLLLITVACICMEPEGSVEDAKRENRVGGEVGRLHAFSSSGMNFPMSILHSDKGDVKSNIVVIILRLELTILYKYRRFKVCYRLGKTNFCSNP